MDFIDVVLEAKGKKKKTVSIKAPQTKSDEKDVDSPEEETGSEENVPEDDTSTDYTEETPDNDEEGENVESIEEEPTGGGPDEGDTSGDDDTPPDDAPTDYTDNSADDDSNVEGSEDSDESGGEDTTDDSSVDSSSSEEDENEARNKRLLQEDYIDLYFKTKDFTNKLASIDKSNVILNQIIVQIDKNLNRLKTALWDYIVYDFDRTSYVTNLFKYNQMIEVFKANVEMLSLARQHVIKEHEIQTKKAKNTKAKV